MSTSTAFAPVRILHLSDIHFRSDKTWDSDPVLRHLVRFIAREVAGGFAPDLVAVTGDLAFSGRTEEYALASEWLAKALWPALSSAGSAPLPRERLLLVPGNHDVDRRKVDDVAGMVQDGLIAKGEQDSIAAVLGDDQQRDVLIRRHACYLDFHGAWRGEPQPVPWWQRTIEIRGQRLHIAGLDSAWMACGDTDRGRLLLGRWQIHQTVDTRQAEGADWRLALLHHPWDYLAEFDAQESREAIHLHRDLVLRGHLHEGEASLVWPPDPERACLELAAGCVYESSRYPNAFHWIELYSEPKRVRVLFRIWNKGAWQIDRNQPGCPEGEAEILLRSASAQVATRVSTGKASSRRAAAKSRTLPRRSGAKTLLTQSDLPDQNNVELGGGDGAVRSAQVRDRMLNEPEIFDCFLSHNSKDKPAVRKLAEALSLRGLKVWLDEDQLRPGVSWQPQLEAAIRVSRSIAVLVGADGLGPWEDEEQQAALHSAVRDKRPVIPVLLADASQAPDLPMFLGNRTWVDLRPPADSGSAGGIERLIWGITGRKPGAPISEGSDIGVSRETKASGARQEAQPLQPAGARRVASQASAAIHRGAVEAITVSLELIPALCAALAKQPAAGGAATPVKVAARFCASQGGFLAALDSFVTALPEAARQHRRRGEDLASLRRNALDVLGWMVVTTVLDGYGREDSERIQAAWIHGGAFHIPLGRSPCIEVLVARWRGGKAEFSTEPKRFDYGRNDITPERFGEIGFDDPRRLDPQRAVAYVWRRVYQDVHGEQAPPKLPPAKIRDLGAWLNRELKKRRRLRLVIDRYDLDEAFAIETTLQAIHDAIPQIHLIVIDSGASADPGVFVLPASDLAAGIFDCLKTIEGLA